MCASRITPFLASPNSQSTPWKFSLILFSGLAYCLTSSSNLSLIRDSQSVLDSLLDLRIDNVFACYAYAGFAVTLFFVKFAKYKTLSDFLSYFKKISPFCNFSLNGIAFFSSREYIFKPSSTG